MSCLPAIHPPKEQPGWAGHSLSLMKVIGALTRDQVGWGGVVWAPGQDAVLLLCHGPKPGQGCWQGIRRCQGQYSRCECHRSAQPHCCGRTSRSPRSHAGGHCCSLFASLWGERSQLGPPFGASKASQEAYPTHVTPGGRPGQTMVTTRTEMPAGQPTHLVTVSWWFFTTIVASVLVGSEPGRRSDTL